MNKMKLASILCLAPLFLPAEQYRLKFPTTVDIIDGSEVIGSKRLKAGTLISLETEEAKTSEKKDATPSAKESASEMPYKLFQGKRPKSGAWFRCKIELDDYYNYDFAEKKSVYQSIDIHVYRPDGQDYDIGYAYFKKAGPVGKKLMSIIKDGNSHLVFAKLVPAANKDDDSSVLIDFKPIAEEE